MRTEFLLLIILAIIGLGIYYQNDGQLFVASEKVEETSTSTPATFKERVLSWLPGKEVADTEEVAEKTNTDTATTPTQENKANSIDGQTASIRDGLLSLTKDLQSYVDTADEKIVVTAAGTATLKTGKAKESDPDREYITLTASKENLGAINITNWEVLSTITNKSASIPEGNRYLRDDDDRHEEDILLYPGEVAYLITGDTPLKVSFRENICTGYLNHEADFSPSLTKQCPLPGDELLRFGGTNSSNSNCNEFVNDLSRCEIADEDDLRQASLRNSCENFIEDVLDYRGCVAKHDEDANYFDHGVWRIYLEENGELWLSSNETIELRDSDNNLVDTLNY